MCILHHHRVPEPKTPRHSSLQGEAWGAVAAHQAGWPTVGGAGCQLESAGPGSAAKHPLSPAVSF